MAGTLEREASVGMERAGGEAAARAQAEDLADPEVRVQELAACQIQTIVGGTGAVGGGVRQHSSTGGSENGILKRKERIGKVVESF
jgi:hypothetical protein